MNKHALQWDQMAKAYDDFTSGEDSYSQAIEWPAIQKMLPDLRDKSILDLGCGSGRFSFLFEDYKPRKILAMDLSSEMIRCAKEKAQSKSSHISFLQGDMIELALNENFDFIFSSTALHYVEAIEVVFKNIYKLLKDEGTCIVSLIHPIYAAFYPIQGDDWSISYLDKSERSYLQPWIEYNKAIKNYKTNSYHHTVSDYLNAIINAGLSIERIDEPEPPLDWLHTKSEKYQACINKPTFLLIKISKRRQYDKS